MYISFLNSVVSLTYFTLAKQSRELGAYKLARHAYEKLQVKYNVTCTIMSVHTISVLKSRKLSSRNLSGSLPFARMYNFYVCLSELALGCGK